jgi:hypothetical protein
MPKYVASRTLRGPLTWNATLLEGDLVDSVRNLKAKHHGALIVTGAGELARSLVTQNLVDEFWFTVSPYLWPAGPRVFDELSAIPLDLVATRTFPGGIVQPLLPAQPRGHTQQRVTSNCGLASMSDALAQAVPVTTRVFPDDPPRKRLQVRATNSAVVAFYKSLGYEVEERLNMGRSLDGQP